MPDKREMLHLLSQVCRSCGMCELGWDKARSRGQERDPHVPGWHDNLSPMPQIMVVGQNPGWNEVIQGKPFIGAAGAEFDKAVDEFGTRYAITRNHFYITNAVKCFTRDNSTPLPNQLERCEPFLRMEINTIKPKFIIALGAVAFGALCPESQFSSGLGTITVSKKYGVKVFATYHPSPLNLQDSARRAQFRRDIALICRAIFKMSGAFEP